MALAHRPSQRARVAAAALWFVAVALGVLVFFYLPWVGWLRTVMLWLWALLISVSLVHYAIVLRGAARQPAPAAATLPASNQVYDPATGYTQIVTPFEPEEDEAPARGSHWVAPQAPPAPAREPGPTRARYEQRVRSLPFLSKQHRKRQNQNG